MKSYLKWSSIIYPFSLFIFSFVCLHLHSIRKVISSTSTLPSDHFCYLRSISEFFKVLDFANTKTNVFKNNKIQQTEAQKLFRVFPFVYVENDIVYDVFAVLSSCQHWETVASTKAFISKQSISCSYEESLNRTSRM